MPELHAQGVELVVNLLDAADHVDNMDRDEIRRLLRDAADVLGELLRRDKPERHSTDPVPINGRPPSAGKARRDGRGSSLVHPSPPKHAG